MLYRFWGTWKCGLSCHFDRLRKFAKSGPLPEVDRLGGHSDGDPLCIRLMVRNWAEARSINMRLKREDCEYTKHDFVFSAWEILIGPNDWEDHASGKDGVERYRIQNLPNSSSCPGVYELGVTSIPVNDGRRLRKHDHENIIPVYLGQADNVRTRLQEYGRSGSHLDHVSPAARRKYYENHTGGPGLFKRIFSKGCSIVFRWAPMKNKMKAEKTELELLRTFDYAWNRRGNGECRHADILNKLNHNSLNPVPNLLSRLLRWKPEAFNKREGIKIEAVKPLCEEETPFRGLKAYLLPQILKFSSSQLHLLPGDDKSLSHKIICGVPTGHGSICSTPPVPGRKRCAEHKGRKVPGVLSKERQFAQSTLEKTHLFPFLQYQLNDDEGENIVCGAINGDGFECRRRPVLGRKRCEEHKGKRLSARNKVNSVELCVCGAISDNGVGCSRPPVPGRKRCEEHKGMKIVAASKLMTS